MTHGRPNRSILVTGAYGFLGTAVCRALLTLSDVTLWTPSSKDFDLTSADDVERCFAWAKPEVVVHLACPYGGGGIGYAAAHPAELALGMVRMDSLLIAAAHRHGVRTFLGVGSVCAYPERVSFPTGEDQLWQGYPEAVNAPYGLAKRMQLTLLQAARTEWGLNGIHLILANLYGPGDHFGTGLVGHIIPSTIVKCRQAVLARENEIVAWGDGSPTREFCYIDDAAAAIRLAVADEGARLHGEPVNVVSGEEVRISEVVYTIADLCGHAGETRWDASKPNGQYRRHFDNQRARMVLGWEPRVPFREGLRRTVDWYVAQERLARIAGTPWPPPRTHMESTR